MPSPFTFFLGMLVKESMYTIHTAGLEAFQQQAHTQETSRVLRSHEACGFSSSKKTILVKLRPIHRHAWPPLMKLFSQENSPAQGLGASIV